MWLKLGYILQLPISMVWVVNSEAAAEGISVPASLYVPGTELANMHAANAGGSPVVRDDVGRVTVPEIST